MNKASGILLTIYFFIFFWFWFIITWICIVVLQILFFKSMKKLFKKLFSSQNKISVFYLEVFGPESAGNKYRTSKWVTELNSNNFKAKSVYVFEYHEYLQLTGHKGSMPFFLMGFMWFRFCQILQSAFYDVVIVRRELLMFNDYGNLFFEKLLKAVHAVRILDFDDDIAAAKKEPRKISLFGKLLLEHPKKFSISVKHYSHFIPGTGYLKVLLKQYLPEIEEEKILVLPTCVDYDHAPKKIYPAEHHEIIIGWVGTRSNAHNLNLIVNSLNLLSVKFKFRLLVICNAPYLVPANFPIDFIRWDEKNEISNLLKIDIGIMPLENTPEQKGKCGFKLIQYMGCGIVSMATALTINNEIIEDGINGFLIPPDADWTPYFEKVFQLPNQFPDIGNKAFEKILSGFAFSSNKERLFSFLKYAVRG